MPPLLAVEPGSITDVPAEDLGNVWTVFTKCKENLKDGRRLENLSWRLWYREITANNSNHPNQHQLNSLPVFDSPPFTQPSLSREVDTASEHDEANTTDEDLQQLQPLDQISIALPTQPSSHAAEPSHTAIKEETEEHGQKDRQEEQADARDCRHDATPRARPSATPRANSDSSIPSINVNPTYRTRRPSSFNLGKFMTTHVDVAEFKASALNQSPAPQPFSPDLEAVPTLSVDVDPPSTPPSTSSDAVQPLLPAPTFAIIQATPRPTPPDSPKVSMHSYKSSATLLVPNNLDRYFVAVSVAPPSSVSPTEADKSETATPTSKVTLSQEVEAPVTTEPVPVDDPRKRKTFFFKESPGAGGQHSPNSDASSSTTSTNVAAIPAPESAKEEPVISASPTEVVVAPEEEKEQPEQAPAPVVKASNAVRKGKEPVKHTGMVARPSVNRAATGRGGRAGGGHGRHHSTNVAAAPRVAPVRSKSAAVITLKSTIAALAPLEAVEEHVAPKRSASSSRLQSQQRSQSTASSSKTVMAPPPTLPTKKLREPSPLRPQTKRNPSPRALARAPSVEPKKRLPSVEPKKRSLLAEVVTKQQAAQSTTNPATATASGSKQRSDAQTTTSSDFETTDTEEEDDSSWASDYSDDEEDDPTTATGTLTKEAAVEAARQRDMFAKVPTRSYSDLANQQKKPGLLTSLFHPDPSVVPYLPGGGGLRAHNSAQNLGTRPAPMHNMVMPGTSLVQSRLTTSKSSAAVPLAAQVTVTQQTKPLTSTQVKAGAALVGDTTAQVKKCVNPSGRPGYRLQGRPEGMEVESSDSEDDEADSVPLSKSVAQRKLEALAGLAKRKSEQQQAQLQAQQQGQGQPSRVAQLRQNSGPQPRLVEEDEEYSVPTPSAPIGLPHPYNLPVPAPPATPRTTRRQMFATEMTESMRRQLMWERETNRRVMGGLYKKGSAPRKPPVAVYANEDFHATGW
ncbi:hypothetical protein FRB94_003894 [Tulasnella sp. JGI-2019a]|nr:hypothetical protein FRB94_003894 [Tulasnella sp. JGI-2019a]